MNCRSSKLIGNKTKLVKSDSIKGRSSIKFQYIWPNSIPESWNRIITKKNIVKLNILQKDRNTLEFLEETQKYISRIRKPIKPEEIEITPRSFKSQGDCKKLLKLLRSLPSSPVNESKKKTKISKPGERLFTCIKKSGRLEALSKYSSPTNQNSSEETAALSLSSKRILKTNKSN